MPSGEDVHGVMVVPYCPYLPEKKNIVLENGPFMDDLPIKNRDFPVLYVCLAERIRNICDEIR